MDFGAKGDGVTDDTQAFKDAIESAITSITRDNLLFSKTSNDSWNATVFIPQGKYNISDSITISGNNRICGINIVGCGMPVIDFNKNGGFIFQGSYVTIKDIEIQNATTAINFDDGNNHCPYVSISNVLIKNVTNGIRFTKGTFVTSIEGVIVLFATNDAFNFGLDGTSLTVSKCYAAGCKNGYVINNYTYSVITGCACDGCEYGYSFSCSVYKGIELAVIGCGLENASICPITLDISSEGSITFENIYIVQSYNSIDSFINVKHNNGYQTKFINTTLYNSTSKNIPIFTSKDVGTPIHIDSFSLSPNITLGTCTVYQDSSIFKYIPDANENTLCTLSGTRTFFTTNIHVEAVSNSTAFYSADVTITANGSDANITTNNVITTGFSTTPTFTYDTTTRKVNVTGMLTDASVHITNRSSNCNLIM